MQLMQDEADSESERLNVRGDKTEVELLVQSQLKTMYMMRMTSVTIGKRTYSSTKAARANKSFCFLSADTACKKYGRRRRQN